MADTIPKPDLNYYYIKPVLNIPNISVIILIIVFFCYLMIQWNYISINWDNEKCNNANFFLAPLYGKDSASTIQQCTSDIINKTVNDSVSKLNLTTQISDLRNNVNNFQKSLSEQQSSSVGATFNSAANIISGIQNNIDNVKTSLSKVLGSVILNSYMYNGVIQSTQNLQNTDLVNMVTQYNAVQKKINTDAANPATQVSATLKGM